MPKKPLVRTLMGSQHDKGSEKLLKSARQWFCEIFHDSEIKPARKILF